MFITRNISLRITQTHKSPLFFTKLSSSNKTDQSSSVAQPEQPAAETESNRPKLPLDTEDDPPHRQRTDPRNTSVILFPGQGTQYVGMAKNLQRFPRARKLFKLANEVLNYDLLKMCLEGPRQQLDRTEYAQLAVLVSSLAALEQLSEERPRAIDNCVAAAGFSLGEITALVFTGAISFDKALPLVQVRATAMQMACDQTQGGMAITMYGPDTNISEACEKAKQWCLDRGIEDPYCGVANYMYPHCKVLAGHMEALKFLEANSKALRIKRMRYLPVSGAFHTPLMESAVDPFRQALRKIQINTPAVWVYSNVDGKPYRNPSQILKQLPNQIVRPVKWEQTMHEIYARKEDAGFPRTFECGPGKGLKQVLEKVNAKAANSAYCIEA